MAQKKKPSIDKQLDSGWRCLYAIEVDDSISEELMLAHLEKTAEYIASIRSRKRLSSNQREKLAHLEKWYGMYDLNRLKKSVNERRKAVGSHN